MVRLEGHGAMLGVQETHLQSRRSPTSQDCPPRAVFCGSAPLLRAPGRRRSDPAQRGRSGVEVVRHSVAGLRGAFARARTPWGRPRRHAARFVAGRSESNHEKAAAGAPPRVTGHIGGTTQACVHVWGRQGSRLASRLQGVKRPRHQLQRRRHVSRSVPTV